MDASITPLMEVPVKIETNVPMLDDRKYPFPTMEVGDSLFAAGDAGRRLRKAAASYSRSMGAQRMGWKFKSRAEGNGVRIWRKS